MGAERAAVARRAAPRCERAWGWVRTSVGSTAGDAPSRAAQSSSGYVAAKVVAGPRTTAKKAPPTSPADPQKIQEEIFALYRQHCPEKSGHDVEVILGKFAGREAELLARAREKYVPAGI